MDALALNPCVHASDHPAADEFFYGAFRALLGEAPYPWQFRLFEQLVEGRAPTHVAIPSGCGKSAVPAIWLLAVSFAALVHKSGPGHHLFILRHTLPQSDTDWQVARSTLNALVTANLAFGCNNPLTPVLKGLQSLCQENCNTPLKLLEDGQPLAGKTSRNGPTITLVDAPPIHLAAPAPVHVLQTIARQIGVPQDGSLCFWPQGYLTRASGKARAEPGADDAVLALDKSDHSDHRLSRRLHPSRSIVVDPTHDDNCVRTMLGWALQFESQRKWVLICTTDPAKAEAIHKGLSASLSPGRVLRVGSEQRAAECSETFESFQAQEFFMGARGLTPETVYLLCTDDYRWVGDIDADVGIFDHASEGQQAWRASRVNRSAQTREGVVIQLACPEDEAIGQRTGVTRQPMTTVLWRTSLPLIQDVSSWLNTFPVQPRERLQTTQANVHRFLRNHARQCPHEQALLIPPESAPEYLTMERILREPHRLERATLILPSHAGGLRGGFLAAEAEYPVRDLADVDNIRERWIVYRSGRFWHGRRLQGIDRSQRHALGAGQPRQALSALEKKTGLELVHDVFSEFMLPTHVDGTPEAYQTWLVHPDMPDMKA
ncbi:hypothetical protein [Ectothiorhodospira sp. BSL-9]|uniref:hypothetical protein n=1 Tax=Ectothiorhodospira sp. BSL-9 TaxID=1442136 RepID=UPI0007B43F6D|nr:hypothetical protein [Ectothiorhodospira sp. BSL-9]ANB03179.1 hypothetical protein ECTOBSL9_2768 [Ectothiorhodospira sp. BSL-9]